MIRDQNLVLLEKGYRKERVSLKVRVQMARQRVEVVTVEVERANRTVTRNLISLRVRILLNDYYFHKTSFKLFSLFNTEQSI